LVESRRWKSRHPIPRWTRRLQPPSRRLKGHFDYPLQGDWPPSTNPIQRKRLPNAHDLEERGLTSTRSVSTYIFEIPNSDMKLEIHNLTNPSYDCARRSLLALVLNAAAEFNGDVARFGKDTPSAGLEYVLMMPGLELRLLKVFIPPFGYMTYDQLRTVVLGLQLYMIIGKRPQAIGFKVLFGDDDVVLGYGAITARRYPDVS